MAQKTKAAARSARTPRPQVGKSSKVKNPTVKAQAKRKTPDLKVVAMPTPKKVAAKSPERKTNKAEKQIAQSKAALKKQVSQAQVVPVTDGSAAVKVSRSRKLSIEINPNEAASALAQKWFTLYKKAEQIEAKPYNMRNAFEEKTAILHKVLGWGYILANRNDRLEVLFKDGIKYLISNYKP